MLKTKKLNGSQTEIPRHILTLFRSVKEMDNTLHQLQADFIQD